MYSLLVTYKFDSKEKRDGFLEAVTDDRIASIVKKEDGCVTYDYEVPEEPTILLLHEEWETKDHQIVHTKQSTMNRIKAYKIRFGAETTLEELSAPEELPNPDALPNPNIPSICYIKNIIKTRRSTRKFKEEVPCSVDIVAITEAGRMAPSGCNVQQNHFLVIKNQDVLAKLRELVRNAFAEMEIDDIASVSIKHSVAASRAGEYVYDYNTPLLIVVANDPSNPNHIADTACAIENMMIMANELDLGSCWINQLRWQNENPAIVDYLHSLGMEENERVFGAVAIGYPDTSDGLPEREPLPRTGNVVTII